MKKLTETVVPADVVCPQRIRTGAPDDFAEREVGEGVAGCRDDAQGVAEARPPLGAAVRYVRCGIAGVVARGSVASWIIAGCVWVTVDKACEGENHEVNGGWWW